MPIEWNALQNYSKFSISDNYRGHTFRVWRNLPVWQQTVRQKKCDHSVGSSTIKIDLVTEWRDKVVPIEVKAEVNVRAKSLRTFITKNPALKGLRFSMLPYADQGWMENVPMYACMSLWLR